MLQAASSGRKLYQLCPAQNNIIPVGRIFSNRLPISGLNMDHKSMSKMYYAGLITSPSMQLQTYFWITVPSVYALTVTSFSSSFLITFFALLPHVTSSKKGMMSL